MINTNQTNTKLKINSLLIDNQKYSIKSTIRPHNPADKTHAFVRAMAN